jgi:Xaa-Pro aminopeptidase
MHQFKEGMIDSISALRRAEEQAAILFKTAETRGLIRPGRTERDLNSDIYSLAFELFGIKKYWHKRIVRAGRNTLLPYADNPPDLTLQADDILFLDFGPVFEEWEADFGRTYVLGSDPEKLRMKRDVEHAWHEGKAYFDLHRDTLTGSEFYAFTQELAKRYGWEYGNEHCGHLIGNFPHEGISGEKTVNYIHPDNHLRMSEPDDHGNTRYWIYEIHLVDKELGIGGFFEQLIS